MHYVLPAAQSLRNLYALSSERVWFALATIGGLLLAEKAISALLTLGAPELHLMGY
ncbi:hypothetical protein [Pararhodobacter marinus]|uniref:hypothetical protein n=1 Tax=Pararhodobacter marinus TaxID=2184063 RepID=UPI00143CCF93|nr:hypothetical protein [Pararhodobacter marinus]